MRAPGVPGLLCLGIPTGDPLIDGPDVAPAAHGVSLGTQV